MRLRAERGRPLDLRHRLAEEAFSYVAGGGAENRVADEISVETKSGLGNASVAVYEDIGFRDGPRIVKAHPVNSDVAVCYNPADITEAVLQPGAKGASTTTFLAALMFVGSLAMVGIYLYVVPHGSVR